MAMSMQMQRPGGLGLGLPRRLLELGRLRTGDKVATANGKERPNKLTKWRMTSPFEALLIHAADLYGGEVKVWADAPGEGKQWELYTDTDTLDCIIPPGALSQAWEMWSGGGCMRRCDSMVMTSGEPCACAVVDKGDLSERKAAAAKGKACKAMTRLSVVLPRVPGIGTWRVTTSSMSAGVELPGTIDLLEGELENRRLIPATLILDARTSVSEGKTMHFGVPVLMLHTVTTTALLAGTAGIAIGERRHPVIDGPAPQGAIGTGDGEAAVGTAPTPGEVLGLDLAEVQDAVLRRVNALRPASRVGECMRAFRERFGGMPAGLTDAQIDDAVAFVAGWEPTEVRSSAPTPPQPPVVPEPPRSAPEHRPVPQPPVQAPPVAEPAPSPQTEQEIMDTVTGMDRATLVAELQERQPRKRIDGRDTDGALRSRLAEAFRQEAAAARTNALTAELSGQLAP